MSMSPNERAEFLELLALLREGQEVSVDRARLRDRVLEDPEARCLYIRRMHLVASLRWSLGSQGMAGSNWRGASPAAELGSAVSPAPIFTRVLGRRFKHFGTTSRALALAVSVLLVGYFVLMMGSIAWERSHKADWRANPSLANSGIADAILSDLEGCQWEGPPPAAKGEQLTTRDVCLQQGLMELQFQQGATVVVEGPAEFKVCSPNSGFLKFGKIIAKVPQQAVGFTVSTPSASIVDLGTEFGLEVDSKGVEQVHVIEGRVRLSTTSPAATTDRTVELHAGEGALWKKDGAPIQPVTTNANRFVRAVRMPKSIDLEVEAYATAVKKSAPLAYWRFEHEDQRLVRNEMGNQWPARLYGDVHLDGPAANRRVVFHKGTAEQWIAVDDPIEELVGSDSSIELWVKPDRIEQAHLVCGFEGDPSAPEGGLGVTLLGAKDARWPGQRVRFVHNDPSVGRGRAVNAISSVSYRPGQWHHIVAVKADQEMRLYLNAELAGKSDDSLPSSIKPRILMGRQGTPAYKAAEPRQLAGELDEVALYNRALTVDEIQEHFNSAKLAAPETK